MLARLVYILKCKSECDLQSRSQVISPITGTVAILDGFIKKGQICPNVYIIETGNHRAEKHLSATVYYRLLYSTPLVKRSMQTIFLRKFHIALRYVELPWQGRLKIDIILFVLRQLVRHRQNDRNTPLKEQTSQRPEET